jgi:serine O-acetyltransferase
MLHHVTLGGSGKKHGIRHPQIGDGVLIGAGAILLGNLTVGDGAQIGACSLVLEDVPAHATVVGVPAKVVFRGDAGSLASKVVPALVMEHERCIQQSEPTAQPSRFNGVVPPSGSSHASTNSTRSVDSTSQM